MKTVNMHEAKTQLSQLVERALTGETILIARAGVPVVRLISVRENLQGRKPGLLKGQIRIAPDFDQTPPEVLASFEGGS